jgi:MFS family permease
MNALFRIKAAKTLSGFIFWVPVIVIFFRSLGLTDVQTYGIIAFYAVSVALLEFPTGVIADYYSQAFSVKLGYLVTAIGLVLICVTTSLPFLYFGQLLSAVGAAMCSGSDTALLKQHSTNVSKDLKHVKILFYAGLVISTALGSFMYTIDHRLPVVLSAAFNLIAFIIILPVHENEKSETTAGNIFAKAREGILIVSKNKVLLAITLVSGFVLGFEMCIKFLLNDLFSPLHLSIAIHGVAYALFTILHIFGISLYKGRRSRRNMYSLFLFPVAIFLVAFSRILPLTLLLLATLFFLRGINDTFLEIVTLDEAPKGNVASILSFKSFLQRIMSSIFTLSFGLIIANSTIFHVFGLFGIFFSIIVCWFIWYFLRKSDVSAHDVTP